MNGSYAALQLGQAARCSRASFASVAVAQFAPRGGRIAWRTPGSTFLTGNVLAGHLRLRVLAVDLNPDFGTLADLAPDRTRAPLSLVDLLRDKQDIASPGGLRPYLSRLPSGLHLLAAPLDPAVMAQMTPELYGELLEFLRRFYEVILLDLGTGVTAPIATFAVDQADQVVVVTTPEWITNTKVQMALGHLGLERATLVLNNVDGRARRPGGPPSRGRPVELPRRSATTRGAPATANPAMNPPRYRTLDGDELELPLAMGCWVIVPRALARFDPELAWTLDYEDAPEPEDAGPRLDFSAGALLVPVDRWNEHAESSRTSPRATSCPDGLVARARHADLASDVHSVERQAVAR